MRNWILTQKILVPILQAITVCFATLLWMVGRTTHQNDIDAGIANAKATIAQFKTLRAYYTENVVSKVKGRPDLGAGSDHAGKPDVIPLPATMIHDLSRILGQDSTGIFLKLYSAFPFPNRQERALDGFLHEAIGCIKQSADQTSGILRPGPGARRHGGKPGGPCEGRRCGGRLRSLRRPRVVDGRDAGKPLRYGLVAPTAAPDPGTRLRSIPAACRTGPRVPATGE